MDIVTLTDDRLGLDRQWVRITEITENDDGTLLFAAEDYLAGTGSAASYSFASGAGYSADYNIDPGDALAPIVFEPPVQIASRALEIWLATAGGPLWGGADIYVSSDGTTYKLAARTQRSGADRRADGEFRGRRRSDIRMRWRSISHLRAARCSPVRKAMPISAIRFVMSRVRRAAMSSSAMRARALPAATPIRSAPICGAGFMGRRSRAMQLAPLSRGWTMRSSSSAMTRAKWFDDLFEARFVQPVERRRAAACRCDGLHACHYRSAASAQRHRLCRAAIGCRGRFRLGRGERCRAERL